MTVRMDAGIKAQFDSLCQQFGMSANAAMNIFANAVVKTKSIPFKITAYQPEDKVLKDFYDYRREVAASDRPELTMEEINEALSGNLCRCGGYDKYAKAVKDVADGKYGSVSE